MKSLAMLAQEAGEQDREALHAVMNDLRAVLAIEIPDKN